MIKELSGLGTKFARLRTNLFKWYLTRASHPFKDKIVGRFWWWFAKKRFVGAYDKDLLIELCLRDYMQSRIFFEGYYEPELVDWVKCTLQADDVFWDVGANVGAITLVASKLCRVVAFEPNEIVRRQLVKNIQINRITNVNVQDFALSDRHGQLCLAVSPDSNTGMSSIVRGQPEWRQQTVATRTADSLVFEDGIEAPTVVKIDVEGAELMVIEGAKRVLSSPSVRAIVLEAECDGNLLKSRELSGLLSDLGFQIVNSFLSDAKTEDGVRNFIACR